MQWLRGRVLNLRPRDRQVELHQMHCVVSLSKIPYPLLSTDSTKEKSRHD